MGLSLNSFNHVFTVPGFAGIFPSIKMLFPANAMDVLDIRQPTLQIVVVTITSCPQDELHCLNKGYPNGISALIKEDVDNVAINNIRSGLSAGRILIDL